MKSITRIHVLSSVLFLILSFILFANSSFAETETFIKEYTYHAGDEDSRNSSRTIALREVKRLLLEELGTYLESQTEVKNFQMTKDQITTLTAGIVSTEVIEDTWDGKVYWLKAKIAADPQGVIKSIDGLRKDCVKVKELEKLRKRSEELLKENARLNKELKEAKASAKQETTQEAQGYILEPIEDEAKGVTKQELAKAYKLNVDNLSATEWFELGISGNYTDAVKAFSRAIELDPQYADAYVGRGGAYVDLGNYQQAIKDYNKAIELDPQDAYVYGFRGYAYGKLGKHQQAIKDYSKSIELNPQGAVAYNLRGSVYGSLGNYQQEIKDYNKAIELDPMNEESYLHRGMIYSFLKNYQMVIKDLGKAIELGTQSDKAYFWRGNAYAKIGNDQQAIKDYTKAIELNQQNAKAYHDRGFVYRKLHDYNQTIKDYNKAIELDPQYADAYYGRGLAYGKLGNHQQAMADIKIAARLGLKQAQDFLKSEGIAW